MRVCAVVAGLSLLLGATSASAEPIAGSPPPTAAASAAAEPAIFGDWNGFKTRASNAGVDVTATYFLEGVYSPVGGDHPGVAQAGELDLAATVDTGKLIGVSGGTFQLTITDREGRSLSIDRKLDTLTEVQQIYGRGDVVRLSELSYDQKFFGGGLQVKLGQASEAVDFAVSDCDQQNLTFCGAQPGIAVARDYWYNTPVAPLMVRIRANLTGTEFIQIGAYDANPRLLLGSGAFDVGVDRGSIGTLVPAELGWTPRFGGVLSGRWVVGGWYFTGRGADVYLDDQGRPLAETGAPAAQRRGRYGGYMVIQQQLTHPKGAPTADSKLGWSAFVNITRGDQATSVIDNAITAGVKLTGTFPGRSNDEVAIAFSRNHVNSRLRDGELIAFYSGNSSTLVQNSEYISELYYSVEVIPGLSTRPNLQYIQDPGGSSRRPDIVVIGLNMIANF